MQGRIKTERTLRVTKVYRDRESAKIDAKRIFGKFKELKLCRYTRVEGDSESTYSVLLVPIHAKETGMGTVTFDFEVAKFAPVVTFTIGLEGHRSVWGSTSKISRNIRRLLIEEFGENGFIDRIQHSEAPIPLYVINGHVSREAPEIINPRE